MTTEEMIEFATEQLEIFASDSDMGKFLQSVIKELAKNKWISVEERLPEDNSDVIACLDDGEYRQAYYLESFAQWYDSCDSKYELSNVIAWIPIPEYHFAEADKKIGDEDGYERGSNGEQKKI